jgi:hypothetical protein
MLANGAHLRTIAIVSRDDEDLFADDRARPAPRSRLTQDCPHGLGIGQAVGPDDIERRGRAVIESDMKRPGSWATT